MSLYRRITTVSWLALLLLQTRIGTTLAQSSPPLIQDLSCDAISDDCPFLFDGVCQAGSSNCPSGTDCGDCDDCLAFSYDCEGCVANGCYWCPGDALCSNSDQFRFVGGGGSCDQPEDYVTAESLSYRGNAEEHWKSICQIPPATSSSSNNNNNDNNFYTDPLYSGQRWVLDMVNVQDAWEQSYTGQGVRVRINDNGIDVDHEEFSGRVDLDASCPQNYLPKAYSGRAEYLSHGTAVAGIVGAGADNAKCSVGMAPRATLSSCDIFDLSEQATDFLDASQLDQYDISQNSFGDTACRQRTVGGRRQLQSSCPFQRIGNSRTFPCNVCNSDEFDPDNRSTISQGCERAIISHCSRYFELDPDGCLDVLDLLLIDGKCRYGSLSTSRRQDLSTAIRQGRDGKGILLVWASGNEYESGGEANAGNGFLSSRFVLAVGAVGKDGLHASYSNPGSNLFVVAPGGDSEEPSNHITSIVGNSCGNAGIGTSYACPVVSGVLALVLEANPNLTWRDVQYILVQTSSAVRNDSNDDTATVNGAGIWHSNFYGFGIIQAGAAVRLAETWTLVGPEQQVLEESGQINLPISDDPTQTMVDSIQVSVPEQDGEVFQIETVAVLLQLEYFSRGHLEIVLISPSGTRSILHPGRRPENTQVNSDGSERWKLLSRKHWGELPNGAWTLEITDLQPGEVLDDCVNADWQIDQEEFDPLTCQALEDLGLCAQGAIDPNGLLTADERKFFFTDYKDNGLSGREACCACGGEGVSREDVTDQLIQWTLVIYGQQGEELITPPPTTSSPTDRPTSTPTTQPVSQPTLPPVVNTVSEGSNAPEPSVSPIEIPPFVNSGQATSSSPVEDDGNGGDGAVEDDEDESLRDKIVGIFTSSSPYSKLSSSTLGLLLLSAAFIIL